MNLSGILLVVTASGVLGLLLWVIANLGSDAHPEPGAFIPSWRLKRHRRLCAGNENEPDLCLDLSAVRHCYMDIRRNARRRHL